jgi:pilus assembly protein CpaC
MRPLVPLLLCSLSMTATQAFAQIQAPATTRSTPGAASSLTIDAGSGQVIQTGRAITNLFAADPKVAEVRPASPTSVFVFGVAPGRTTIAALDQAGNVIGRYDVTVRPSS